jgi:hypothetical protein
MTTFYIILGCLLLSWPVFLIVLFFWALCDKDVKGVGGWGKDFSDKPKRPTMFPCFPPEL